MPMKNPAHPGRIIRQEYLEALGVSIAEAARQIKVSRQALSSVLNGKADLTADMALRLEKAFGIDLKPFCGSKTLTTSRRLGNGRSAQGSRSNVMRSKNRARQREARLCP